LPHVPPEAPLSRTDDRRILLLALGAAGVTLAVVLGVIGLPAVNACSSDPRGVITCLRDMADRKFDLPGSIPGQVAELAPVASPVPAIVVAETEPPVASGGPLQPPAVEPASISSVEPAAIPAPMVAAAPSSPEAEPAAPHAAPVAPAVALTAPPETEALEPPASAPVPEPETSAPDTALTWNTAPVPLESDEPPAGLPATATPEASNAAAAPPVATPAQDVEPLPTELPASSQATTAEPVPTIPSAAGSPAAPLVLANAEPATAQPPAPTVAAPVILAPTIDAIELDAGRSFVSGSGPAGALMRLYADGDLIGESPVEEGRWLVEGSNLLDRPRRELRVEAIAPDTGKLLGVAAITVEIELPDGGAPPDERPEHAPELGSGVAPVPPSEPASPIGAAPTSHPAELADNQPPAAAAVLADQPELAADPEPAATEPAPEVAAVAPESGPEPLPPLAAVVPRGESASVEILGPSSLEPTILPPTEPGSDDASTLVLPTPDAPALIAAFDVNPPPPPGQPVTILRLLPFGDPDEGRYNVGKAIIRRGDTLWSIARRYYGHGIHYRTIFHANRELIRRPSRIFPGQIFDLPLVTDD